MNKSKHDALRALTPTPMVEKSYGGRDAAFRMDAYYYGFTPTGVLAIDLILSAVGCAGKSFHHTESWNDDTGEPYHDLLRGGSPVEWITNAADDAAKLLRAYADALDAAEAERDAAIEAARTWENEAERRSQRYIGMVHERDAAEAERDKLRQDVERAQAIALELFAERNAAIAAKEKS